MFKIHKNSSIEVKREIDGKINFYSRCIDCVLKKIETVNENKLNDLLKFTQYIKPCYCIFQSQRKESKNPRVVKTNKEKLMLLSMSK